MKDKYNYFVSYWWSNNEGEGFGNGKFPFNYPIETYENIREIETYIKGKMENKQTIILNYQLIK